MENSTFVSGYRVSEAELQEACITRETLRKIESAYLQAAGALREIGKAFIDEYLYDIDRAGIHSYRYRIKETDHLLEKIVRKKRGDPTRYEGLDETNFHKFVTDLIGIRVFFLYREDWIHFHRYITAQFENDPANYIVDRLADFDEDPQHYYLAERPRAYKRGGDSKIYDENEVEIVTGEGHVYRSIHYVVKYRGHYIELQCRTLFEEGWSEIDHDIVYPYHQDDEMLADYSRMLNRLSGLADEMSSYFRRMKNEREQ